eukprot:365274-Chlamydomonas_euryale.AAC.12
MHACTWGAHDGSIAVVFEGHHRPLAVRLHMASCISLQAFMSHGHGQMKHMKQMKHMPMFGHAACARNNGRNHIAPPRRQPCVAWKVWAMGSVEAALLRQLCPRLARWEPAPWSALLLPPDQPADR